MDIIYYPLYATLNINIQTDAMQFHKALNEAFDDMPQLTMLNYYNTFNCKEFTHSTTIQIRLYNC